VTRKGEKEQITLARSPRWQALLDGDLAVEDLDDEELLRGKLRRADGKISAKGPREIPRQLHERLMRELKHRMDNKFAEHLDEAIETVLEIMRDGEGAETTEFDVNGRPLSREKGGTKRLAAATLVIERIMGKVEQKTTVSGEVTIWQQAVEGGDFLVDLEDPPVVTAEVVDESPTRARAPVRRRRPREE
jgi:hypothetical protein